MPTDFLAKAEEWGTITAIDHWVLGEAIRQLQVWQSEFHRIPPLTINVNLSAKEFDRPDLVGELRDILAKSVLPVGSLAVEITETLTMGTSERVVAALKDIKELGLDIVIDDFGTGYSALMYLSHLPIDALKIDCSFVSSMATNAKNVEVIRAIVTLAHCLNLKCTAEGVETADQLATLTALGCTAAQGSLFSEPVTADDAYALIDHFGLETAFESIVMVPEISPVYL